MKKLKVIFWGDILGKYYDNGVERTGVFCVAWNVFNKMLEDDSIEMTVYADVRKKEKVLNVLNTQFYNVDWKLLFTSNKVIQALSYLCQKFEKDKENKTFIILNKVIYFISLCYMYLSPRIQKELEKYDIFFSPDKMYPKFVSKNKFIKKAIFLHDIIPYKFPQYYPDKKKNYWHSVLLRNINNEDIYFANSECTKNDFLSVKKFIAAKQITVTLLGCSEVFKPITTDISTTLKKYGIPENQKYVFSLCTIEPRKNLIRIIKSFLKFIEKNSISDLFFVIGGAKWDSFVMEFDTEILQSEAWNTHILYIGYVDDNDLPKLYSAAQWFVYTSQYEGFGLPLLEAMKCGCPVIASNNSSLPEVVGDAGQLIQWDSLEEHITAYEKYYFDNRYRVEMKQKALERGALFSWKKTVNILLNQMKTICEEKWDNGYFI